MTEPLEAKLAHEPHDPPRRRLTAEGRATLRVYGVTAAAWLRLYPACDDCGCPDDRCIGYHHVDGGPCDLQYWLQDDIAAGRVHSSLIEPGPAVY